MQIFAKDPDQKFTLTVDANGGTFPDKGGVEKYTMQIPAGMTLSIDNISKPEKDGSRFDKWTTVYDDGYETKQTTEIHMSETKTGYAILKKGSVQHLKVGRSYRIPKAHLLTYLIGFAPGHTIRA